MARKRGKNQQKKKEADVISAAVESVKAKKSTNPLVEGKDELWGDFNAAKAAKNPAKFELGDGHEDFPYQKGTMQDVGRDFHDLHGAHRGSALTPVTTFGGTLGVLALAVLVTYGVIKALAMVV